MANRIQSFESLTALAEHLRQQIDQTGKKVTLIFAHNGTGKTRLSMEFKELGKTRDEDGEVTARDTLYFNAFTEDLFSWDNDLQNDRDRVLRMNTDSAFFDGLADLEMENRIRPLLRRYADFDFQLDYAQGTILFWRETVKNAEGEDEPVPIKVSRGEENLFIWCFFLAVAQLAMDGQEALCLGELPVHRRPHFLARRKQRHRRGRASGRNAEGSGPTEGCRFIASHAVLQCAVQ